MVLAEIVSEQQATKRMVSQMEEHAAYPTGLGWEDRGGLHFDIPMCMLRNGNEVEQAGIVHPEAAAGKGTRKVRITERLTTPAQVRTGEKIWESGHVKERGDVTAVVKLFGKEVRMTKAERAALSREDLADLVEFEKGVEKMCDSEDAGEKARGEWLRDNVVGRWLFLVDGNSR